MRIPFVHDDRSRDPLRQVMQDVGARTALSPRQIAYITSLVLEGVSDQLSKGRAVSVPGFGLFAPVSRRTRERGSGQPVVTSVVRFSASRGLREQIRYCAPRSDEGYRRYVRHMRNHALGGSEARCRERVFTAQAAIRRSISAQLGGDEVSFD